MVARPLINILMNRIHIELRPVMNAETIVKHFLGKLGWRKPLMGAPCRSYPLCGEFQNRLE